MLGRKDSDAKVTTASRRFFRAAWFLIAAFLICSSEARPQTSGDLFPPDQFLTPIETASSDLRLTVRPAGFLGTQIENTIAARVGTPLFFDVFSATTDITYSSSSQKQASGLFPLGERSRRKSFSGASPESCFWPIRMARLSKNQTASTRTLRTAEPSWRPITPTSEEPLPHMHWSRTRLPARASVRR